jgi:hypothetical protein
MVSRSFAVINKLLYNVYKQKRRGVINNDEDYKGQME